MCDGHGDLRADGIFCLEDGVRILDCLEFSDRLRHGDVCADVSFLAMDLERLGRGDAADRFLRAYQSRAHDRFPPTLVDHYTASRAYVRATVACLRSADDPTAVDEAWALQTLALGHLRRGRVRMVLVGGLPGSGSSTLARGLADRHGWTVLRSDGIRRSMVVDAGIGAASPRSGYRSGRYGPRVTEAVYRELLDEAAHLLGLGVSVVLDASWTDATFRDGARASAEATAADVTELCCVTAPEEADRRIMRRAADGADPSEATPAVRAAMARAMDPWPSASIVDTTAASPDASLDRACDLLGVSRSPG